MALFWQSWYLGAMVTVLLAAGESSRMGQPKLLLPYKGSILASHALEAALEASEHVIVVTGWFHDELESLLVPFLGQSGGKLSIIRNERPQRGQFSSTQTGVEAVEPDKLFTIAMADAPLVTAMHYKSLEPLLGSHDAVRPYCHGIPGHPVLCAPRLREVILSLPETATMRDLLATRDIFRFDTDDPAWITDIDTPEAYGKLLGATQFS